jgi:S1-C subfamily serine protease
MRSFFLTAVALMLGFISPVKGNDSLPQLLMQAQETVLPGMVYIRVERENLPLPDPLGTEQFTSFLQELLYSGFLDVEFYSHIRSSEALSHGIGFLISKKGYILTNGRFTANAKKIVATLPDGSEVVAEVVNSDMESNLTVLKIDTAESSFSLLPDSNLKTAAIALIQKEALYSYCGVSIGPVGPNDNRVRIWRITKDSPAEKAGLLEKDIILECDGVPVTHPSLLAKEMVFKKPGNVISLTILRAGWFDWQDITLKKEVTLTEARAWPAQAAPFDRF